MSRIQNILEKAERDGGVLRMRIDGRDRRTPPSPSKHPAPLVRADASSTSRSSAEPAAPALGAGAARVRGDAARSASGRRRSSLARRRRNSTARFARASRTPITARR